MDVASTVQPYEEHRVHQTKISPALFRSRLEQKIPVAEYLICCVCVLFSRSLAKYTLRMGSCVRFCRPA